MPPSPPDDDLLRRIARRDEAALAALYERWHGPLTRFAWRMAGSRDVAEDVVQEVFVALIDDIARFDPSRGNAAGWLYGIARKQVLRRLDRDRGLAPLEAAAGQAREVDLLAGVARDRDVRRLHAALLAVPAHYREAVVLCDLQGLAYEEAAVALECPVGTVRSRLHRARGMLAERLRSAPVPRLSLAAVKS